MQRCCPLSQTLWLPRYDAPFFLLCFRFPASQLQHFMRYLCKNPRAHSIRSTPASFQLRWERGRPAASPEPAREYKFARAHVTWRLVGKCTSRWGYAARWALPCHKAGACFAREHLPSISRACAYMTCELHLQQFHAAAFPPGRSDQLIYS